MKSHFSYVFYSIFDYIVLHFFYIKISEQSTIIAKTILNEIVKKQMEW